MIAIFGIALTGLNLYCLLSLYSIVSVMVRNMFYPLSSICFLTSIKGAAWRGG